MVKMEGKFIVFEGIDKSGKETQAKMLYDYLHKKAIPVIYTEEPSPKNPAGRLIKKWLVGQATITSGEAITLLYTADRFEHLKKTITPALNAGKNVICDRYFYSTIAYESAIFKVEKEWIKSLHKDVRKPDVVIFIDIDPEISLKRERSLPNDRLEKVELLKNVREAYKEMINEERFFVVNGDRSKEEVFRDVQLVIDRLFGI
ncbi:MAG: dTMP kinase [Candidatus Aenigmarchaeota archaeon]|nr:dTMP kinase [Candidatus Aenigmarchaeota archaeon]